MFQDREYCRSCGTIHWTAHLSNRGLCAKCALERVLETIRQLQAHEGWIWDKWVRSYVAAMDGVLNRLRKELQEND